ncbi:MAG: hypothetical protein VW683_15885, partial [Betaproteobacteria bacterium]
TASGNISSSTGGSTLLTVERTAGGTEGKLLLQAATSANQIYSRDGTTGDKAFNLVMGTTTVMAVDTSYNFDFQAGNLTTTGTLSAGATTVSTGSSGATANTSADDLVVEGSGNTGISIMSPNANSSNLYFASAADNNLAYLEAKDDGGTFKIGTTQTGHDVQILSGNNTLALTIDSSQNIGIGTSSPSTKLDIQVASGGGDALNLSRATTSDTFGIRGDNVGILEWRAGGSFGGGGIRMVGGLQGGADEGTISFHSGDSSGGLQAERMRIDVSGNVGIGTSSPSAQLQVGSGTDALTGTGTGQICLSGAGQTLAVTDKPAVYHRNSVGLGLYSDYAMSFEVNGSSSKSEAMRIDNSGNVGIGTSSPENALDITVANGDGIRLGQIDAAHGGSLTRYIGLNDLGAAGSFAGGCFMAFDAVNTNDYEIFWQVQNYGVGNPKMTLNHDGSLVLDTGGATFAGDVAIGGSVSDFGTQMTEGMVITGTSNPGIKIANTTTGVGNNNGTDIFLSTTGALEITQREAQSIRIHTNNTERMRIDSSGVVSIDGTLILQDLDSSGTDTPEILFDANENAGRTSFYSGSPFAFIGTTATTGGSSPFNEAGNLIIQSRADVDRDIVFVTGATPAEIARVTQDGITFNGDTAAANALDDAEQGTWTPTVEGATSGSLTLTTGSGYEATYVKVGKIVTVFWRQITWTGKTTLVGNAQIGGLPYSIASNVRSSSGGFGGSASGTSSTNYIWQTAGDPGASSIWVILKSISNNSYVHASDSNFASTGTIYGMSFTYITN